MRSILCASTIIASASADQPSDSAIQNVESQIVAMQTLHQSNELMNLLSEMRVSEHDVDALFFDRIGDAVRNLRNRVEVIVDELKNIAGSFTGTSKEIWERLQSLREKLAAASSTVSSQNIFDQIRTVKAIVEEVRAIMARLEKLRNDLAANNNAVSDVTVETSPVTPQIFPTVLPMLMDLLGKLFSQASLATAMQVPADSPALLADGLAMALAFPSDEQVTHADLDLVDRLRGVLAETRDRIAGVVDRVERLPEDLRAKAAPVVAKLQELREKLLGRFDVHGDSIVDKILYIRDIIESVRQAMDYLKQLREILGLSTSAVSADDVAQVDSFLLDLLRGNLETAREALRDLLGRFLPFSQLTDAPPAADALFARAFSEASDEETARINWEIVDRVKSVVEKLRARVELVLDELNAVTDLSRDFIEDVIGSLERIRDALQPGSALSEAQSISGRVEQLRRLIEQVRSVLQRVKEIKEVLGLSTAPGEVSADGVVVDLFRSVLVESVSRFQDLLNRMLPVHSDALADPDADDWPFAPSAQANALGAPVRGSGLGSGLAESMERLRRVAEQIAVKGGLIKDAAYDVWQRVQNIIALINNGELAASRGAVRDWLVAKTVEEIEQIQALLDDLKDSVTTRTGEGDANVSGLEGVLIGYLQRALDDLRLRFKDFLNRFTDVLPVGAASNAQGEWDIAFANARATTRFVPRDVAASVADILDAPANLRGLRL